MEDPALFSLSALPQEVITKLQNAEYSVIGKQGEIEEGWKISMEIAWGHKWNCGVPSDGMGCRLQPGPQKVTRLFMTFNKDKVHKCGWFAMRNFWPKELQDAEREKWFLWILKHLETLKSPIEIEMNI
jgi:hypothetical protein